MLKKIQDEITGSDAEIGNREPVPPYAINFNYDQKTPLEIIEIFENEELEKPSHKTKVRQRWKDEEINEIKKYFAEFLAKKKCPSKKFTLKAIEKSRKNGGPPAKRFWHTIVKKNSNMNKK